MPSPDHIENIENRSRQSLIAQHYDVLKPALAALNDALGALASLGCRVDVEVNQLQEVSVRFPRPVIEVDVTQPIE
jgi:hypothetical protein